MRSLRFGCGCVNKFVSVELSIPEEYSFMKSDCKFVKPSKEILDPLSWLMPRLSSVDRFPKESGNAMGLLPKLTLFSLGHEPILSGRCREAFLVSAFSSRNFGRSAISLGMIISAMLVP